ncbi:DUF484 family protein, partial [Pandoraea sputorum]|uniref:DUF484 family protein n=1 Tax=Pandoraea sputorum TaxID=93222 RepID=UPI0035587E24
MTDQPPASTLVEQPSTADARLNPEAEAVIAYLLQHPEFFSEHDELLLSMRIPHQRG